MNVNGGVAGGVVALKIDVASRAGLRAGVPRLLALLAQFGARASFFVAFGPEDPCRTGWCSQLAGALRPRRRIVSGHADLVRRIADEGHEVGVCGWDHRLWRTRVQELDEPAIREQLELAFEAYERVLGVPPRAVAAPAWHATAASLKVQDALGLRYASDLRDAPPHRPVLDGYASSTLQIPSNRPCLLEVLPHAPGRPGHWTDALLGPDAALRVLPMRAEVEGLAYHEYLNVLLVRLHTCGLRTVTLAEAAEPLLALERGAGHTLAGPEPFARAAWPVHSVAPPGRT